MLDTLGDHIFISVHGWSPWPDLPLLLHLDSCSYCCPPGAPGLSQEGCSQPHRSQPALAFLVMLCQVQDLHLPLWAFIQFLLAHSSCLSLCLTKGSPFRQVHLTIRFGVISKLGESVFNTSIQIIYENVYQPGAQYWSLRDPACNRLPAWVKSIDHHPLSAARQPLCYTSHRSHIQSLSCQCV